MDSTNVTKKRDTELHPWQSPHQNKLLTEPSDFKTLPQPQGWTVTVSHENLTHSSRGVSWLLQPLSIPEANWKLCQAVFVYGCYTEKLCVLICTCQLLLFSHFHASCLCPVQFQ